MIPTIQSRLTFNSSPTTYQSVYQPVSQSSSNASHLTHGRHMQSQIKMRETVITRPSEEIGAKTLAEPIRPSEFLDQLKGGAQQPLSTDGIIPPNIPRGGLLTSAYGEEGGKEGGFLFQQLSQIASLERRFAMEKGMPPVRNVPRSIVTDLLRKTIELATLTKETDPQSIEARREALQILNERRRMHTTIMELRGNNSTTFEEMCHRNKMEELLEQTEAIKPELVERTNKTKVTQSPIDLTQHLKPVGRKAFTKAELKMNLQKFQASMNEIENSPPGTSHALTEDSEVLYIDFSGSSAASIEQLPENHELKTVDLGLTYENEAGARVSAGLASELTYHCAKALSEFYELPIEKFLPLFNIPGDGFEACLPKGSSQILAPILLAFKEKVENLNLGLSSRNLAFGVSSGFDGICLERTSNAIKISMGKTVDEELKRQSHHFTINNDGISSVSLPEIGANVEQKMVYLDPQTLAVGLVFTAKNEEAIKALEETLQGIGISEDSCNKHLRTLLGEDSGNYLQSSFNLPDGNALLFINNRQFTLLQNKLKALEDKGITAGLTAANKIHAVTIFSDDGEPLKTVIGSAILTKASINLKTKYYWKNLKTVSPQVKWIAEKQLGITDLTEQANWAIRTLDGFTKRSKIFNPQNFLEFVLNKYTLPTTNTNKDTIQNNIVKWYNRPNGGLTPLVGVS